MNTPVIIAFPSPTPAPLPAPPPSATRTLSQQGGMVSSASAAVGTTTMTSNDLKVSLTSASKDRRRKAKAAAVRPKVAQGANTTKKGAQQQKQEGVKMNILLAEWKASVGGARNLPPVSAASAINGAVIVEKRDDTDNVARVSATNRQGARSNANENDDCDSKAVSEATESSFSVLAEGQNHNSCQDIVLDTLIASVLVHDDGSNAEPVINSNNDKNDNDCCFINCGAAADNLDDYVCGVVSSGTPPPTLSTTTVASAANDSTASEWLENVLLSIQDIACGNNTNSSSLTNKHELTDIDEVVDELESTTQKDDDTNGLFTRVTATGLATTTTPNAATNNKTPWWKASRKTEVIVDNTYTKKIEVDTKLQHAVSAAWNKTITGEKEKALRIAEEEWKASKKLVEIESARLKAIQDGDMTTVATPRQVTANKNDGEREKKNNKVEVETKVIVPMHCGLLDVDTSKNTNSMMELLPSEMTLAIEELHRSSSLALTRVSSLVPLAFGAAVATATAADDTPEITTSGEDSTGIVEECDEKSSTPTTDAENQLVTVNKVDEVAETPPISTSTTMVTKYGSTQTPTSDQSKAAAPIPNYKKAIADPVSDYVKVGCGSAMMKSLGTRRLISILKSPLKNKMKKSVSSNKKTVTMVDRASGASVAPRRPSTEEVKKDNGVAAMDVSVSSKLTNGTRLSGGNIEVTEAELTQHLDSRMESAANQTNVSDKSVALIANNGNLCFNGNDAYLGDDGYTVIHEANQFYCTDLSPFMALKMIESASRTTDKTIHSDAVTRHVKNGNPNPMTIVEEDKVIETNAFDCGGGLSSILTDNEGVDGDKNDDDDDNAGYLYGQYMRSGQLNIVSDDVEVATHLSARDEDVGIYSTDKTIHSVDDMSGPTMMLDTADSCTMNDSIADITGVIQAYRDAYTSATSCIGSAITEAVGHGNSLAALDEEITLDEDDGTCMSDDRTEATKQTHDTRITCVTEPATAEAGVSTQCRDDTEEEQVNNDESVFQSISAILCCKGDLDEGNDSTAASSRAINDDDRTYNDFSVAHATNATTVAGHSYSIIPRGDGTVFSNDFQLHGAASTTSEANRCCVLPAWYTQDPTK